MNSDLTVDNILEQLITYGRCTLMLTPNNEEINAESNLKITILGGGIDAHVNALLNAALKSNVDVKVIELQPVSEKSRGIKIHARTGAIYAILDDLRNTECTTIDDLYEYLEYEAKTRLSQSYPKWPDRDTYYDERSAKGFNQLPKKQTYNLPINRKSKRY